MNNKGLFVTFEGGEGAGKTTLINRLYDMIESEGESVIKTREPGGTPLGSKIRELLLTSGETVSSRAELLLFMADRAHHVDTKLFPALEAGSIVLCDRYIDSSYAYQGSLYEHNELEKIMNFSTANLIPDLTFFLDLDPQIGLERAQKEGIKLDRIESHDIQFHIEVREAFLSLAKRYKKRIIVVNANQSKDALFNTVWQHLRRRL
ncbi:MAG: dTMP kinase [Rhabdochlamydiaceae bacterium]|nr:dTMP kinase [Candidatus Amphrikana amoebophyrae]